MTEQHQPTTSRSRVKKDSRFSKFFILLLVCGISAMIFWFVQDKHNQIVSSFTSPSHESSSQPPVTASSTAKSSTSSSRERDTTQIGVAKVQEQIPGQAPSSASQEASNTPPATSESGHFQISPQLDLENRSPADLATGLEEFFLHLDQQSYLAEFHLPEQSKGHFSKILQKLLDQPPATTRETDDYFTLLKNTAHFFRIIGKDNTLALKGILDRERDSLESILNTFYILIDYPEILKERFDLVVTKEPLYDYACFFLNTIGGRLYLFRRDATSRMVVSFYAIRVIDKANDGGYNRLGIDLRPFIDALIDEMEGSGAKLRFKDTYLDSLYDMKEAYGKRN